MIRALAKKIIHWFPVALTRNEAYDRQTRAILRRDLRPGDCCIDVGAFRGEILREMIRYAPDARHLAFEPIPSQFAYLEQTFGQQALLYPYALSDVDGETTYHHVESNPTYSGIRRRQYKGEEKVTLIRVPVRRLDDIVPADLSIRLIKIDVEGGELGVLRGGIETLRRCHPILIFEHGLGGSDSYGTTPEQLHDLLANELGYRIGLMQAYLANKPHAALSREAFLQQYYEKLNCYFVAW